MRASLRIVTTLTAGAALAAVPVVAASASVVARGAAAATPPRWRVVRVPSSVVSPSELDDVSASGPADAWAVGAEAETGFEQGRPMLLHWNGRAWSKVALRGVPGAGDLTSVSAGSRSDAWALGYGSSGNLLLHWDSRRWRPVGFPGRAVGDAVDVAAAPGGAAWLVGARTDAAGNDEILVERWNGAAWHIVATGLGRGVLVRVRVSANGDVWAAGTNGDYHPLIVHGHHGAWTSFPGPDTQMVNDVLGVSARDVWAVGGFVTVTPISLGAVIGRWNGRRWATVNVRRDLDLLALSISPGRSGQPQWTGLEGVVGPSRTAYAHYNGTAWSIVPGATVVPGNAFEAFTVTAHIPGTDATWGVGGSADDGAMPIRAIIEFNPGTPPA
jgi:hypothetical protein